MYVTFYDTGDGRPDGCLDCCPKKVEPGADGADEAILDGVFFAHKLVSVTVRDRSRPVTR